MKSGGKPPHEQVDESWYASKVLRMCYLISLFRPWVEHFIVCAYLFLRGIQYERVSLIAGPTHPLALLLLASQADIRESGTLTEHELSHAMRIVMGATPKAGETSRVLRFFGEPGSDGERVAGAVRDSAVKVGGKVEQSGEE